MIFRKLLLALILCLALPLQAAANGMIVIRDTEIETAIRDWSTPIWRAAGLNPDAVKLILVQSPDFNAFVAGGSNIFLYTGMIARAKNPGELLGVIAHETGHIAGGHLIQGREAMERASYEAMLAMLLGIGAGAAGSAEAGNAIIMGGQGAAMSGFLSHSRVQESAADQAALRFLEGAGYNPSGTVSLLETLKDQEFMPASQQVAYVRTHPLTADRMSAMQAGVEKSAHQNKAYPAAWNEAFDRIKAKLTGFVEPHRVGWVYSEKDNGTPALYARAIAAYRRSEKNKALELVNQLTAREPNNPYFHELKGQMLRDFAQLDGAAAAYKKAVQLKPDAALIHVDLAQVLVEMAGRGNQSLYAEAEKHLDKAYVHEPRSTSIQRLYATIYGRQGNEPRARYHLAEKAALEGNFDEASSLLAAAMPGLKSGTREWRAATDLRLYLDSRPKKGDRKTR